jgi:molybdenum cofactor biosynthesis enzyme MoaA
MTDPGAGVNQCCSDWTSKVCATSQSSSLLEIWNGPGFQRARRAVALSPAENKLCLPVCPRLYDRQWSEWKFRIQPGGERFEQNQRIIAEDIANRELITRGMPIRMTITGSTYCNYDCIMCMCGRTPRRELPQSVWDQLPELLPYLWNLDVLGGEPLADRRVTQLLESFDTEKYPDARISLVTNGSLMTARYLSRINLNAIRGLTISLNAGTPESYRDVQRGEELGVVLENLDGLLKTRDDQAVDLNVQLSFVVQPEAIHTLEPFAKIAEERGLEIRLLPMTRIPDAAYYYTDPDKVARVVHHLDEFAKLVSNKPNWVRETRAVRDAVAATAASVQLGERSNPC